jgi:hypothetical protein
MDAFLRTVDCRLSTVGYFCLCRFHGRRWYNSRMTLLEITYELHSPPSFEQLQRLGEFANTYGLRRFRVDEKQNHLTLEYDASRLRETQVAHVLGKAGISIVQKMSAVETTDPLPVEKAALPR